MRHHRLIGALSILAVLALALLSVTFVSRGFYQRDLRQVAIFNCQEIERLKAELRRQAVRSYENLDNTLRLLGIRRSAEVEETARANRDYVLGRFKQREGGCRSLDPAFSK